MIIPELYYTSFFILLPALYGNGCWIGNVYTIMLGLSVLNHAKAMDDYVGKKLVRLLDRSVAHLLGGGLVLEAIRLHLLDDGERYRLWLYGFWGCLLYVIVEYHVVRHRYANDFVVSRWLHTSFHLIACLGGCCIVNCLQGST